MDCEYYSTPSSSPYYHHHVVSSSSSLVFNPVKALPKSLDRLYGLFWYYGQSELATNILQQCPDRSLIALAQTSSFYLKLVKHYISRGLSSLAKREFAMFPLLTMYVMTAAGFVEGFLLHVGVFSESNYVIKGKSKSTPSIVKLAGCFGLSLEALKAAKEEVDSDSDDESCEHYQPQIDSDDEDDDDNDGEDTQNILKPLLLNGNPGYQLNTTIKVYGHYTGVTCHVSETVYGGEKSTDTLTSLELIFPAFGFTSSFFAPNRILSWEDITSNKQAISNVWAMNDCTNDSSSSNNNDNNASPQSTLIPSPSLVLFKEIVSEGPYEEETEYSLDYHQFRHQHPSHPIYDIMAHLLLTSEPDISSDHSAIRENPQAYVLECLTNREETAIQLCPTRFNSKMQTDSDFCWKVFTFLAFYREKFSSKVYC